MGGRNGSGALAARLLRPLIEDHLPLLVFIVSAVVLMALLRTAMGGGGAPRPVAKPFLSAREAAMRDALEQILPMYRLHAQVAMGALLKIPWRPGRKATPADRNSFSQKIVDFVVEDPTTGRVVALIEVDDRSHVPEKDRARDAMLAHAGYRTVRIPASTRPSIPALLLLVGPLRNEGHEATAMERG